MMQEEALKILKTGANVFLTGEPGSGKTHTINAYVSWLRDHGIEPAITASTGIAATHIGGMTIHSWSGIGVREYLSDYDLAEIVENKSAARRAKGADVLIIDEVSMLSASILEMLDQVLRAVRERQVPFGGMQVIVVGDFFQLPPVVKRSFNEEEEGAPFAFRSRAWGELNPLVCYLHEQHRQEDAAFTGILKAIRKGTELEQAKHALAKRAVGEDKAPQDAPRLFSHNRDVDRINEKRLEQLTGKAYTYEMTERGPDGSIASLKRGCLSPEKLTLKKGARVMFTKNDPAGQYVNGTTGEVISFASDGAPTVRTTAGRDIEVAPVEWIMGESGRIIARISQLPLKLAWAITVHKSQGMTLDEAVVDLTGAFEYGQGYVALSRVRSLDGLHLIGFNERALQVHPEVAREERQFKQRSADARARFAVMEDREHREISELFLKACGGSTAGGVAPKKKQVRAKKGDTQEVTLALAKQSKSIKDIAKERNLKEGTIIDHLQNLFMREALSKRDIERMISPKLRDALPKIAAAFKEHGTERLTPVHQALKGVYSFDELKLVRILL